MQKFVLRALKTISHVIPLLVVDLNSGKILGMTPLADNLFGYRHGELDGELIEILAPVKERGRVLEVRKQYSKDPHVRDVMKATIQNLQCKDGTVFKAKVGLAPVMMENRMCVSVFILPVEQTTLNMCEA